MVLILLLWLTIRIFVWRKPKRVYYRQPSARGVQVVLLQTSMQKPSVMKILAKGTFTDSTPLEMTGQRCWRIWCNSTNLRRKAINYVASGEEFIMVQWSSRNHEMAFECPKAMFKSENGIVANIILGHPEWASRGGLKRLVLFIGGTYACLLNVCTHMFHPN